jgi:hypothetical protein
MSGQRALERDIDTNPLTWTSTMPGRHMVNDTQMIMAWALLHVTAMIFAGDRRRSKSFC